METPGEESQSLLKSQYIHQQKRMYAYETNELNVQNRWKQKTFYFYKMKNRLAVICLYCAYYEHVQIVHCLQWSLFSLLFAKSFSLSAYKYTHLNRPNQPTTHDCNSTQVVSNYRKITLFSLFFVLPQFMSLWVSSSSCLPR